MEDPCSAGLPTESAAHVLSRWKKECVEWVRDSPTTGRASFKVGLGVGSHREIPFAETALPHVKLVTVVI